MNIKHTITISFVLDGFHKFPSASLRFGEKVKYLEDRHRHNFYIEAEKTVTHTNRDSEFILLMEEVRSYLENKYGRPAEFDTMSCEQICDEILTEFDFDWVSCKEDNENGGKSYKI